MKVESGKRKAGWKHIERNEIFFLCLKIMPKSFTMAHRFFDGGV